MSVKIHAWEQSLLSLAHEAWQTNSAPPQVEVANGDELTRAYEHCESVIAANSRSFLMASCLLPRQKRQAVRALYAFCRITDDLVDEPADADALPADLEVALTAWRGRALTAVANSRDPVVLTWADVRRRFRIPQQYAEQLVDGVAQDIYPHRYETFADLTAYCYRVASTVGLMSMHIIGFSGPEAIPYALKLGVALQLTNILRDVGADWLAGRLYLPLEELRLFGLGPEDIEAGQVDARWRKFMRFQIERNRQLYEEAWPGIALLHRDGRFSIAAAAELYRAILEDIEAHDFDVFSRRAHINTASKLRRLPAIWWRSQTVRPPQPAAPQSNG